MNSVIGANGSVMSLYLYLLLYDPIPVGFSGYKFDSVGDAIEPVPLVRYIDNTGIRAFPLVYLPVNVTG